MCLHTFLQSDYAQACRNCAVLFHMGPAVCSRSQLDNSVNDFEKERAGRKICKTDHLNFLTGQIWTGRDGHFVSTFKTQEIEDNTTVNGC